MTKTKKPTKKTENKATSKPKKAVKTSNLKKKPTKKIVEKPKKKKEKKVTKPIKKEVEKAPKKIVTDKKPERKVVTKKTVNKKHTVKKKKIQTSVEKPIVDYSEEILIPTEKVIVEPVEEKKERKFNKTPLLIGIIIVLVLLLFVCIFMLFRSGAVTLNKQSNVEEEVIRTLPKEADPIYKETWKEYHDKAFVPDDYKGQIIFESGIINEPVLQGDTNETYIRRNYETYKYEVCGPVFMDYICDVESDQNLILYGHNRSTYIDPEHVMMFSPLHVLEKEENYDENKIIYMAYEDRLDIYLVASVYPVKIVEKDDGYQYLVEGEPLYYLNNYSPDQFDTYIRTVKQKQLYDTGVELVNTDELLTLQTCYEDKLDKFIVLAKKIGSVNYKED